MHIGNGQAIKRASIIRESFSKDSTGIQQIQKPRTCDQNGLLDLSDMTTTGAIVALFFNPLQI